MKPILLLLSLLLLGCPGGVCEKNTQRCFENTAQLCDTAGKWRTVMDCAQVRPKSKNWECVTKDGKCTCLPGEKK